jgi:uncharacterized protein YndB with AHSA1/START domain
MKPLTIRATVNAPEAHAWAYFTWRMEAKDGRRVEIRFEEVADGTAVTEIFDPESENPVEMQRDGWAAILENYRRYTAPD